MRKALTASIVASAVAFTAAYLPLATPTSAASCDDVQFIFARGSGQKLGDSDYLAYKSAITSEFSARKSTLKYGFYELGTSHHGGASYPAIELNPMNILSARISAGAAFSYGESVNSGVTELKSYIDDFSASCKDTKFVVAGYSQGAQVVTTSLPNLNPDKFIYAATFGDPKLYLPEGKGAIPDACLGKNLSSYRVFAPNCYTYAGSLDAQIPYHTSSWQGKVGLWCKDKDLVCGAGIKVSASGDGDPLSNLLNSAIASHTSYPADGIFASAATTIVDKVDVAFLRKITMGSSAGKNLDTVLLLDTTDSMDLDIFTAREEARRIARETINAGGNVALYVYGDLGDRVEPRRLVDFGESLDKINYWLDGLPRSNSQDPPESLLSALLTVMNEQNWHAGAIKSIIVFTDAGFHSPDIDGTTLPQVVSRSLSIDPVNVYVLNSNMGYADEYAELTTKTGGAFKSLSAGLSTTTTKILSRPNVNFPLSDYSGKIGDEFSFSVITSGDITTYEWDLDFDGVFEVTTSSPTINKSYTKDGSGYIQARATDSSGNSSTASAFVNISSTTPVIPTLKNAQLSFSDSDANITYEFGENTIGVIVSIDDALIGVTNRTSFSIANLSQGSVITLRPISRDGYLGEPVKLGNLGNLGKGAATQEQILVPSTDSKISGKLLAPNSGAH